MNKGQNLYNSIQTTYQKIGDRRKAIKQMRDKSEADYIAYINYQSNLRKKEYMKDANTRDRVYADNREYKEKMRRLAKKANPVVKDYVRRVRTRLQVKKLMTSLQSLDINDLAARAKKKAMK